MRVVLAWIALALWGCSSSGNVPTVFISPSGKTRPVSGTTDDCAIWIHPTDPSLSLIIGNDQKGEGGLYGWDIKGHLVFYYGPLLQPVNVDIRYGFSLGDEKIDILVVGTHADNTLRVFKIDPILRNLVDITVQGGIPTDANYQLYGLCLYQDELTGAVSAFITQEKGNTPITQIALKVSSDGYVSGEKVREWGQDEIKSIVKGMYADDEKQILYCCDEDNAVLKYSLEGEPRLLGSFAKEDAMEGKLEAIGLYSCPDGKGYLLLSTQGKHEIKIFDRDGDNPLLMTVRKRGVTQTDGMEVTSCAVPPYYPHGFFVSHDKATADFVLYNWDDVAGKELKKCTCREGY